MREAKDLGVNLSQIKQTNRASDVAHLLRPFVEIGLPALETRPADDRYNSRHISRIPLVIYEELRL